MCRVDLVEYDTFYMYLSCFITVLFINLKKSTPIISLQPKEDQRRV